MWIDESRVVQVFAPVGSEGRGHKGSGYLVADGLVLTARHVAAAASGPCEVRRFGEERWLPASIAWPGGEACDAVLLEIEGDDAAPGDQVRRGRAATDVVTRRAERCPPTR